MARKRVPMLLLDEAPPPKKPPPQKPTAKAPARPAERRKATPPPPAPPPEPKRSKGRQEKVDPKLVAAGMEKITEPAKPHFTIKDVNGTPPPPGTRGAKGPVPPVPHIPPKPPPPGTQVIEFKGGRMEVVHKGRVRVTHDTGDGTVLIEEFTPGYPELRDPEEYLKQRAIDKAIHAPVIMTKAEVKKLKAGAAKTVKAAVMPRHKKGGKRGR